MVNSADPDSFDIVLKVYQIRRGNVRFKIVLQRNWLNCLFIVNNQCYDK